MIAKVRIILEGKELKFVKVDAENASDFVHEIASRILTDLDLHNLMKLFNAAKNEYTVGGGDRIYENVIEIACLVYKHRGSRLFKILNRPNKGTRARSAELATIARSTYIYNLSDEVKRFSDKMKTHYFTMIGDYVGATNFILYVKVMDISGLTVTKMAGSDREDSLKFAKALNDSIKKSNRSEEFDTSKPSEDFLRTIATHNPPYGIHYNSIAAYITALFVLRAMHGERTILEIFDQHPEGLHNPEVFLKVIQNWDRLKDYPLNWILNLLEEL